jgi:hypothetical protein
MSARTLGVEMLFRRFRRLFIWLPFVLAAAVPSAYAQSAKDVLGVPGPVTFQGTQFILAWSSNPSPGYFKQEYLPAGQKLERYEQMFMIEASTLVTPEGATTAKLAELKKRKASDPTVNWDIIRNNTTGEIILDFILSHERAEFVEWNAYRYARLGKEGGVALYAISRRGYGDKGVDFLRALKQARPVAIRALAAFDAPPLQPKP